jgi:hypothetical protein
LRRRGAQTTRRCHWVPESYLRGFAADPEKHEKIWRFSKTSGEPELKPIAKVAVKFHLYCPADATGRRNDAFEKKLSSLEQWFNEPIWRKLQVDMVDLSWQPLRKLVALMVAIMFLRNPTQFEKTKTIHGKFVDFLSELDELPTSFEHKGGTHPIDVSTWPQYRDATDDDLKTLWISQINSATHIAEMLFNMRWAILFSDTPSFVTSDNPVTFLHPSLIFQGIKNPDTTILFPLSPTRVLSMDNRHDQPDAHYYPLKGSPATTNLLIWRNAIDHLFSPRHPDLICTELVQDAEQRGIA